MLINIFCGLVFFTLRFSRFNLTQPVWALLVYLLIVLFTGGVLWLRGFEFLTFILIIVVVGRLAVYFLITVLTYFKGDVREVPYFVSFVARYVNIPAMVGFYGVFLFFLRQLKMVGKILSVSPLSAYYLDFFFPAVDFLTLMFFSHGWLLLFVLVMLVVILVGRTVRFSSSCGFNKNNLFLYFK